MKDFENESAQIFLQNVGMKFFLPGELHTVVKSIF